MKVGEAMRLEPVCARPDEPVMRVAEIMRDEDAAVVPILDGKTLVGAVTQRDLAVRFVAAGLDFSGTTASDVMSRDVLYLYEDEDAGAAMRVLERRAAAEAVVVDSRHEVVGIVGLKDLAAKASGGDVMGAEIPGADAVNLLIKDELAAVRTYREAVARVHGPAVVELRRLENEHEKAAALLQQAVAERGIEPATGAGVWGVWSEAVERASTAFGESAAIRTLIEGERHGVRDYERALEDRELPSDIRALIQTNLLPQTREHIPSLDRYAGGRGPRGTSYNADQGYGPEGGGRGVA